MQAKRVTVTVFRFDPEKNESPKFENHGVPYTPGMTLLDALRFIQSNDPTMAFRWECRKTTCGSCAVMVNGQPMPACQTKLEPQNEVIITPLSNFPIIRDLVVGLRPALERLNLVKPYLVPGKELELNKEEADRSRKLRTCIECWACVAACPVAKESRSDIADPVGMLHLARFALDKRDDLDRHGIALELGLDLYDCTECQKCVDVCPKGINIAEDVIAVLRNMS